MDRSTPEILTSSRGTGQPRHGRMNGGRRSYDHLPRPATRPTPPPPRTTEPHARVARHKWPENEGIVAIPHLGLSLDAAGTTDAVGPGVALEVGSAVIAHSSMAAASGSACSAKPGETAPRFEGIKSALAAMFHPL